VIPQKASVISIRVVMRSVEYAIRSSRQPCQRHMSTRQLLKNGSVLITLMSSLYSHPSLHSHPFQSIAPFPSIAPVSFPVAPSVYLAVSPAC